MNSQNTIQQDTQSKQKTSYREFIKMTNIIAIITLFFDIFCVLFMEIIKMYLKQYIYIFNVCCFNGLCLES